MLVRHPATLLSQHYLLTEVWGPGCETAHGNLRRYMAQLRRKLEPDPSRPQYFWTEPGMGYLPALVRDRDVGVLVVVAGAGVAVGERGGHHALVR